MSAPEPGSDADPDSRSDPARPRLRWPVGVLVVGLAGIFSLLSFGPRGNEISGIVSTAIALIALYLSWRSPSAPAAAPPTTSLRTWWTGLRPRLRATYVAGCLVVGAALGWGAFQLSLGPPAEGAYLASIQGGSRLAGNTRAVISFAEPIPQRDHIGLRLSVADPVGSGDCVRFTVLRLQPVVNGARTPVVDARPSEETQVDIDVGGPITDLTVEVVPVMDEGCRIDVGIEGALFYD
jgi:hypothetical protein